jgi:hypothetical protein
MLEVIMTELIDTQTSPARAFLHWLIHAARRDEHAILKRKNCRLRSLFRERYPTADIDVALGHAASYGAVDCVTSPNSSLSSISYAGTMTS